MPLYFEYKNMSFEKVDDIWIHKDWALPGDFGDIHDKPASKDLSEKVELAYQVWCLEKKLKMKEMPAPMDKEVVKAKSIKEPPKKMRKKDIEDIDMTKTLEENNISNFQPKPKKTNLIGSFNPFKDGFKI